MSVRFKMLTVLCLAMGTYVPANAHNGHITSAEPVSGIRIDGDLSDWPSEMQTHSISTVLYVCDATPTEDGFLGRYRVGYNADEGAIYVAVEIEDDRIVLDAAGDQDWNSRDACELFLDLNHADATSSTVQFVYRGKPYATFQNKPNDDLSKAVKVARASDDTHILYEWRVDLNQLSDGPVDLAKGTVFGFDVAYLDRDSVEEYAFYSSSPGKWKHVNSSELGDLMVAPPSTEIVDFAGKVTWNNPGKRPAKFLNIQANENEAFFYQVPLAANGQFMVSLPKGEYQFTTSNGPDGDSSDPVAQSIDKDTLLKDPIEFSVTETPNNSVVLFDLAHGQRPLPQLKQLGKENGFSVKKSKQSISADVLKDVDVLYLLGPTTEFSAEEKEAVTNFVRHGGSLLLVVDESRRSSLEETQANDLIEPFGITLTADTEYVHNCGGLAKSGNIHEQDLEIPYSGGRAVEGGTPFAFQIDRDGQPSHPFAAYTEVPGGGRAVVLGEAMAAIFLGTPNGERLSGTPRNYFETEYWGKDSAKFNADVMSWLLNNRDAITTSPNTDS